MEQKEKSRQSIEFIINCAINEFNEHGEGFSINLLCKKYGISKGKLYHHFTSKEDLIAASACHCFDSITNRVSAYRIDSNLSIEENLHYFYQDRIDSRKKDPKYLLFVNRMQPIWYSLNDEVIQKISQSKDKWRQSKIKKILDILRIDEDNIKAEPVQIAKVINLMYEHTLSSLENQMVNELKHNEIERANKSAEELLKYHDSIMDMILYGGLKEVSD